MSTFFTNASAVMTAISFVVFLGIVWWTYVYKRAADFDSAAQLPFADEPEQAGQNPLEKHHG